MGTALLHYVWIPLADDQPVALGILLPDSLLAPHRQFCDAIESIFFLVQALFDLKVQSPLNKKRSYSPSLAKQDTERKPERTTAISPARIVVIIQRRSKTKAKQRTEPTTPKIVKSSAKANLYTIQKRVAHGEHRSGMARPNLKNPS